MRMKLFVIEGIDGSGKSTQIKLLRDYFRDRGLKSEYLHFPRTGAPFFGELVARFLRGEFGSLSEVDPYLVAMLYAGDRHDAATMIKGWLGERKIVLLDRYTYSNIAYQCAKIAEKDLQDKLMRWILKLEFEHFAIPKPDLNIFLDVPFSFTEQNLLGTRKGDDRSYLNGTRDIHEESMNFQKSVRDMYLRVASTGQSIAVIECSDRSGGMLPPDTIFRNIITLISDRKLI